MTIIIGRWDYKPAKPYCCCGQTKEVKRPKQKQKPLDVIHDYRDAPPGLRRYFRNAPPGGEWFNWTEYNNFNDGDAAKPVRPRKPMLRAVMPDVRWDDVWEQFVEVMPPGTRLLWFWRVVSFHPRSRLRIDNKNLFS